MKQNDIKVGDFVTNGGHTQGYVLCVDGDDEFQEAWVRATTGAYKGFRLSFMTSGLRVLTEAALSEAA